MEVKDDLEGGLTGNNPDIAADLSKEIKSLSGNVDAVRTSILKDFEAFKEKQSASFKDMAKKEEIDKIQTSFLTKFEEIQKESKTRSDNLEAALKRAGKNLHDSNSTDLSKEADIFHRTVMSRKGQSDFYSTGTPGNTVEEFGNYVKAFDKFIRKGMDGLDDTEKKALSTGTDPSGGYLVRPAISSRVIQKVFESSPLRELATVETIGTDRLQMGVDNEEFGAEWVGEVVPQPRNQTTTPGLDETEIVVREMSAKPRISQNNLDDSTRDMDAWIIRKVGNKFGRTEATAFVAGNGIAKPRGLLTYAAGTDWGQVEQVNTGATSGLTYGGILDITVALKEPYHGRATWLMRRASLAQAMKVQDGDNAFVFAPMFRDGRSPLDLTILGYPIRMASDMPAIATDALSYAFGDFAESYTIVDRQGIRILRDPFTADPFVIFKTYLRVGGGVVNFEAFKIGKCNT